MTQRIDSQLCFNFSMARLGEEDTQCYVNIEYSKKSHDHKVVRFSFLFAVEISFFIVWIFGLGNLIQGHVVFL